MIFLSRPPDIPRRQAPGGDCIEPESHTCRPPDIDGAPYTPELKALWAVVHRLPDWNLGEVLDERMKRGDIDQAAFIRLAEIHSLAPLLYDAARNRPDGESVLSGMTEAFNQYFYRNLVRHTAINRGTANLLRRFNEESLQVIPLKGIYLAEKLYRLPAQRPMDDVDLLVRKSDAPRAEATALEVGFRHILDPREQRRYRREVHHIAPLMHKKFGFHLELHTMVGESAGPYKVDTEALFDRSRPGFLLGVPVRQLLPEDFLIHLAVHMISHVRNSLLQIADLRLFFDSCDFSLSSPHFTGLAEEAGVLTQVYFAACLALADLPGFADDQDLHPLLMERLDTDRIHSEIKNGSMLTRRQWATDETTERLGMPAQVSAAYKFSRSGRIRAGILAGHLIRRAFPGTAYIRERYNLEKASAPKAAAAVLLRPFLMARSWLRTKWN